MTSSRSIDEFSRLVTALQTSDANDDAPVEGWQTNDKVIVPQLATAAAAHAGINEDHECVDWYFCKKSVWKVWIT